MIPLIDSHAHLDQIENIDRAMEEARRAGVLGVVTMGVDLESMKKNFVLQDMFDEPAVYGALGIHPGNIQPEVLDETLDFVRTNLHRAVAVGEIGLDYWYKWARKDAQQRAFQQDVFRRQLVIAREHDLPVVVHSRGAWKDCLEIVREAGNSRVNFHWYTGPLDILERILECGFFVSAGPALAYSEPLRDVMRRAPIGQVLLETDSPVFYREGKDGTGSGFSATPKDVARSLQAYARLFEKTEEDLAETFVRNTLDFFNLKKDISRNP